jgi:RNA recognition motif-containing protein
MSNKIICRKCGGEHLTIKCGKDTQNNQPIIIDDKKDTMNIEINNPRYNENHRYNRQRNYDKSKLFTVKLSELPLDTTESELYELLQEWGHIVKVKVSQYKLKKKTINKNKNYILVNKNKCYLYKEDRRYYFS